VENISSSVGDSDPDSQDLHVFGPPGSGSISQRYGYSAPAPAPSFSHKCVERSEIMPAKKDFNTKF
jgi:hypothetical protein